MSYRVFIRFHAVSFPKFVMCVIVTYGSVILCLNYCVWARELTVIRSLRFCIYTSMASLPQDSQILSFCIFKPELGQKEGKVGERHELEAFFQ